MFLVIWQLLGRNVQKKPDVSPLYNIKRDEPAIIHITQAIDKDTAKLIVDSGNADKEMKFDLGDLVFEFENDRKDYENKTPYVSGGSYQIVPKDGLKIEDKLDIEIHHCVLNPSKPNYIDIEIEFNLKVNKPPMQLAKLELYIGADSINPVQLPTTRIVDKIETHQTHYEVDANILLKNRRGSVGQKRDYGRLFALVGGKEKFSEEFQIPTPQSTSHKEGSQS